MNPRPSSRRPAAMPAAILMLIAIAGCALAAPPIYTADSAPATPKLADLKTADTLSQYDITWTFDKEVPVGRFVNGDLYVVGPVTVVKIDPTPTYGKDGRNGSMLNVPPRRSDVPGSSYLGFDSRIRHHRYKADRGAPLPIAMKPGDALVSTISLATVTATVEKDGKQVQVNKVERVKRMMRGSGSSEKPTRTLAVLTCVAQPLPPDAFRPAYVDREQKIFLARNLRRDRLPSLQRVKSTPELDAWVRMFQRPWLDVLAFTNSAPIRNMPMYGREVGRAVGIGALMLCCDFPPEQKEPLIINYVQVGIDLWGLVRAGHAGWQAHGGHHIGRKLPIVIAGTLLGDDQMAKPTVTYPGYRFQEDMQTMVAPCWTGAKVVYAGHAGANGVVGGGPGKGRPGWGAYEHLHPSKWKEHGGKSFMLGESYRRCCTSHSWIGQALALKLIGAEKAWNHDPFFDYCDRWMTEDDTEFVKIIQRETGAGESFGKDWAKQGGTWDPFVDEMWARYRPTLQPPPTGWRPDKPAAQSAPSANQ